MLVLVLVKLTAHGGRETETIFIFLPSWASAANGEVQKAINLVTPHRRRSFYLFICYKPFSPYLNFQLFP